MSDEWFVLMFASMDDSSYPLYLIPMNPYCFLESIYKSKEFQVETFKCKTKSNSNIVSINIFYKDAAIVKYVYKQGHITSWAEQLIR